MTKPADHNPTQEKLQHLGAWQLLSHDAIIAKRSHLRSYFLEDKKRAQSLRFTAAGLTADFSRHHLNPKILKHLLQLAKETNLLEQVQQLFAGKTVNITEGRSALHMALRGPFGPTELQPQILQCQQKMHHIVNKVHQGIWRGYDGRAMTDIVNIGIGGSDLGPKMITTALTPYHHPNIKLHFVSNCDPRDIEQTLTNLDPATTLFIISSKTWSTLETLTNAKIARSWLLSGAGDDTNLNQHFIAISAAPERCQSFGIHPDNILPMWDWVGGRYSLWSAIGLPIALATNNEVFSQLLHGASDMDEHFLSTPAEYNLPILMALLEIWYVNFWGCSSSVILPYSHDLRLLPSHLQQLIMESNGKNIDRQGNTIDYQTSPIVWGSAGTNGQHSFHQLLHQGTQIIPVDFILPLISHSKNQTQHQHMIANCFAQAEVLMDGQSEESISQALVESGLSLDKAKELAKHKAISGNKPTTLITTDKLTPQTLGSLIALYEHKTFSASAIWNINAFDQWGVELGKITSSSIYKALNERNEALTSNPATAASINEYWKLQRNND